MVEKSFSVLSVRRETQIMKIYSYSYTVCIAHLIANSLSFHMSLAEVMNYGAGNYMAWK